MTVSQTYWADWGFRHILRRTSRQESTQIWFARFNLNKFRRMRIKKSNQFKETLQTVWADPLLPGTSQPAVAIWPIRIRESLCAAFKTYTSMLLLQQPFFKKSCLKTDDHEFCYWLICIRFTNCLQKLNLILQPKLQIGKFIILYSREQKLGCSNTIAFLNGNKCVSRVNSNASLCSFNLFRQYSFISIKHLNKCQSYGEN